MSQTAIALLALCLTISLAPGEPAVSKFAFGSCCQQNKPIPIFKAVSHFEPDVWIWMGDNIYGDTEDMGLLEAKYATLSANDDYVALKDRCRVIGIWDDHDFGKNDAGKEFAPKAASQQRFLDFLNVTADDPRRKREGVYASHTFGPEGKQVKLILLDTRYHRDPLGSGGDVLGEAQWRWLEKELRGSTAQVHLLVSSIQLIAADHRFEKWSNFPKATKRLMTLLAEPETPPVTVLSGDRHLGEISVEKDALPYPLYDITSSSLNKPFGRNKDEINHHRVGANVNTTNFGTLEIDWSTTPPTLQFALRDETGEAARALEIQQRQP